MDRPLPTRPARDPQRRRRQLRRFFPDTKLGVRIDALPDLGLVYVRNPKVATSTILGWLELMHSGQQQERVRDELSWPGPRALGWDRVMRMLDGEAFRFSFVRDPLTRFESAYRSKVRRRSSPGKTQVVGVLGWDDVPETVVELEDFVRAVEQQDPLHMDLHWRPQHLNLMHPVVTYDLLGRLERFDEDIEEVRRRLDLPALPAQTRNVSRRRGPSGYDGRPDLVERVRAIYARDLELYDY